jgi:hypothetical protein
MASVILTNWTVYYSSDAPAASSGYKQIKWTGAGSPESTTNTVNELYSALSDLFSIPAQNDANDTVPMQAVTPTVYNIGSFDQRDLEPWFIDPDSVKHLTGGSLQTVGWTRVVNADANLGNPGIVKVAYTVSTAQFVASDIGRAVVHASGDTGTLLYFASNEAWIRPTDCTSTHNWDTGSGTFTATGGTGSVTQSAAPKSGECLWANIYTIGTIESGTLIYVYQNLAKITGFWSDGHIDRLILINDGFASGLIDSGLLIIYARQYTKLFDHYVTDVSAGGRNPIPLSTAPDVNNTTGYRTLTAQSATGAGTFNAGNYIYHPAAGGWSAATAKGVITAVAGTSGASSTPILSYYLIGDLTDFANGNTIKEYVSTTLVDGDGSCTASAPTATGPNTGTAATITVTFGVSNQNLNNGAGSRPYSVIIDCQQTALTTVYQRLKYLTERRETADIDTLSSPAQTLIGNEYKAIGDYYIPYDTGSIDNPFTEGETITATGSFSCVLTSKHDRGASIGFLIVRNVRGTVPVDNTVLTGVTSTHTALVNVNGGADPVASITPSKTSPFGTFAGGNFFGARGVWLTDYLAADSNKYQLIDSENTAQTPPATVPITVNGIQSGDRVSVFRALDQNGTIDRAYIASHATSNSAGSTTWTAVSIPVDTPSSGYIRLRKTATQVEERVAYSAWSGVAFTLSTSHSGGYGGTDTAYVPYLDDTATGTTMSVNVTYDTVHDITTRVRKKGIQPYTINTIQLTSTGYTATATRIDDTIAV